MKAYGMIMGCAVAGVLLGVGASAQQAPAPAAGTERQEAVKAESSSSFSDLQPAVITLGARAWEEGSAEGIGDLLLPVYSTRSGLFFLNPRSSFRDEESEMNLGAGYRQMIGDHRMIAGLNAYYDRRETEANNQFHQAGFGAEFLSEWVDARVNYYLPENDIKDAGKTESLDSYEYDARAYDWDKPYARGNAAIQKGTRIDSRILAQTYSHVGYEEQAMEGFDCEVGVRLPIPLVQDWSEVKLFAGYYSFDNDLSSTVEGWKGRLEVRAVPALLLDAEVFEDDDLNGSSYYVGARMQVPFDMGAWAAGKNPFAGTFAAFKPARRNAARPFDHRLTEMVMRDPRVQASVSEPTETVEFTVQEVLKQVRKPVVDTLSDSLIYVDRDNTSGVEDGSYEHPFSTIGEGLEAAGGDFNTVYVFDSATPYTELNIIRKDGISLIGSGSGLAANGGRRFATGIYPVLSGAPLSGASGSKRGEKFSEPKSGLFVTADDVTISGLEFRGAVMSQLMDMIRDELLPKKDDPDVGDLTTLLVLGVQYSGILALDANNLMIQNNIFAGNAVGLMVLEIAGDYDKTLEPIEPHSSHNLLVANNRFEGNAVGMLVLGGDSDWLKNNVNRVPSFVYVADNQFQDNLLGVGILQSNGGLTTYLGRNHFNTTLPAGIGAVLVNVGATMEALVEGNTVDGNHTIGMGLIQEEGNLRARILDNTFRDCQLMSLLVEANSINAIDSLFDINLFKSKLPDYSAYLEVSGNTITGNGRSIDLTEWLGPVSTSKDSFNPVIPMPDIPAMAFALNGSFIEVNMVDNEFSRNRGGALFGMIVGYNDVAVRISGLHGSDNGGLFQRNDPGLYADGEVDGLSPITDYSALIIGKLRLAPETVWEDNHFSNSRLLAMYLYGNR